MQASGFMLTEGSRKEPSYSEAKVLNLVGDAWTSWRNLWQKIRDQQQADALSWLPQPPNRLLNLSGPID